MRTQFDLVIIGSGAGGSPIANRLAKAGKSVLILEKGPLFRPNYQAPGRRSSFRRDELISDGPEKILNIDGVANKVASYYSSHVEPDLNDEPHVYRGPDSADRATIEGYTAQVVGGGTQLYGGVSLRYTPTDLRLKSFNDGRADIPDDVRREARDWPIPYDVLDRYYAEAEDLVGINGTRANQIKPFLTVTTTSPRSRRTRSASTPRPAWRPSANSSAPTSSRTGPRWRSLRAITPRATAPSRRTPRRRRRVT